MRVKSPSTAASGGATVTTKKKKMSKINSERKGKMVNKQTEIVEITPDRCTGWKKMSKKRKIIGKQRDANKDAWTPLRGIFCLKKRQDMKIFEEKEDCFILDFDPNDSFEEGDLSSTADSPYGDDDVTIIHEKGQVACRDYPHSRHLCSKFPFGSTQHAIHCKKCYCYVCDSAAPCPYWTCGYSAHCDALDDDTWRHIRMYHRNLAEQLVASKK